MVRRSRAVHLRPALFWPYKKSDQGKDGDSNPESKIEDNKFIHILKLRRKQTLAIKDVSPIEGKEIIYKKR